MPPKLSYTTCCQGRPENALILAVWKWWIFFLKRGRETHLIPHLLHIMRDYSKLQFPKSNYHAIKNAAFSFRPFYVVFTAPLTLVTITQPDQVNRISRHQEEGSLVAVISCRFREGDSNNPPVCFISSLVAFKTPKKGKSPIPYPS